MPKAYVILWEFEVREGKEKEFERMYGPGGDWARLFATSAGYRGTELHRDAERKGRYVTRDEWESREAYERFRAENQKKYETVDAAGEGLTVRERRMGAFEVVEENVAGDR